MSVNVPPSVGDVARWAFWGPFRKTLSPERPRQLALLRRAWRLQHALAAADHDLMAEEYRRCFSDRYTPAGRRALVRDAYRCAFRVHLEELLLADLDPRTTEQVLQVQGRQHLEAALSRGRGVVWVYPHAGPVMLMLAWLAHHGYRYTQFAARGLAPPEVAAGNPERMGTNWFREATRRARESHEDSLPATFLTQDTAVRALHRTLQRGEIVGIAFDGRLGRGFAPLTWLGRTALLSPGPYKLAVATGAPIVPAFCRTARHGPSVCEISAPIEPGDEWQALARRTLSVMADKVTRHPEEYGLWLLHCRKRRAADDHPLFVDYAPDDRYQRWMR